MMPSRNPTFSPAQQHLQQANQDSFNQYQSPQPSESTTPSSNTTTINMHFSTVIVALAGASTTFAAVAMPARALNVRQTYLPCAGLSGTANCKKLFTPSNPEP